MSDAFPNPLAAVVAYLAADTAVAAVVEDRVFGESLPDGQAGSMPRAVLVVAASPGSSSPVGRSRLALYPLRVDVKAYGATPYEATQLYFAVHRALVDLDRQTIDGTLLHDAVMESTITQLRDADGKWPMCFGVYTVLAAAIAAG